MLSTPHFLVEILALENHHGAYQLNSGLDIVRRQRADGGVEELVGTPWFECLKALVDYKIDMFIEHVVLFDFRQIEQLGNKGSIKRFDLAVDFDDLLKLYRHGLLLNGR